MFDQIVRLYCFFFCVLTIFFVFDSEDENDRSGDPVHDKTEDDVMSIVSAMSGMSHEDLVNRCVTMDQNMQRMSMDGAAY